MALRCSANLARPPNKFSVRDDETILGEGVRVFAVALYSYPMQRFSFSLLRNNQDWYTVFQLT